MTYSLPSPPSRPQSLLGQFLQFVRRPHYTVNLPTPHSGRVDIPRLYALALLIVLPLGFISAIVATNLQTNNAIEEVVQTVGIEQIVLLVVVFAPLFEEAIFRLPLRYTPSNLVIPLGIGLLGVVSALMRSQVLPEVASLPCLGGIIALVWLLRVWLQRQDSKPIHQLYEKWIGWLFYGLAILFGLIHLGNFSSLGWQNWFLAPLLVLPQTALGVFLGFIRLRYGFWWAVLTHAIHNALALTPLLLVRLGSEKLLNSLEQGETEALQDLAPTDYMLLLLLMAFVVGILMLCIVTVWFLIGAWLKERRQP
ncbi:CPBP family intramembrane glutamic endopeptidase [Acaryochloris sp. IP29b_bin.148]|uniref:CPBP family intramembrane glutamic endopeptidase n=1 Tax=Acaryochloris sp. IP29b_bin.148 TaxID=2969218 RepID=UPI00260ABD9E|nr:CPBP family intramembrane glutamic endopeptidase [Acaryochloris sp. IP29b_bin.148]